jgi:hypothetical protein
VKVVDCKRARCSLVSDTICTFFITINISPTCTTQSRPRPRPFYTVSSNIIMYNRGFSFRNFCRRTRFNCNISIKSYLINVIKSSCFISRICLYCSTYFPIWFTYSKRLIILFFTTKILFYGNMLMWRLNHCNGISS